jgi:hypothetical protein
LGQALWWRASRTAAHRIAAVEGLPDLASRGQMFNLRTRTGLARLVMRKLPGGRMTAELLRAAGPYLIDAPVESFRRWLLEIWTATDLVSLERFATLPARPADKAALLSWALCRRGLKSTGVTPVGVRIPLPA